MASFRKFHDSDDFRVFMAEPQPNDLWDFDPQIADVTTRDMLTSLGAEVVPFHSKTFGASYPNGNKIEALALLPEGEPFIFFDTDTIFTASLKNVASILISQARLRDVRGLGPSRIFMVQVMGTYGNHFMTSSGWTSRARSICCNRTNIGRDTYISTLVFSITNAPKSLVKSIWNTQRQFVMIHRTNWMGKRSIRGSTRLLCR